MPKESQCTDGIQLEGDIFHHICRVCRQGMGDRFEVILDHKAYFVEIDEIEKKRAKAKILEERSLPELPKPHIHLALSLPKFQTLEKVLEKSVELGVHSLHPFHSDFSFMKPKKSELGKKFSRWRKIIQGATQQTGRGDLMELTEMRSLNVLLEESFRPAEAVGFLAYEGEGSHSMKNQLSQVTDGAQQIWIFVGSEGGFSQKDLELFKDYELLPMSLGDQVLRVETACVTLVGILKYGLGHYG